MEDPQLEDSSIHVHCEACIKINKCTTRPQFGESCEIISCSVKCGAKFHACKGQEHKLLCMNEKVPCINAINGCPLWMARKYRGRHLETCPASVVHCTMEWNRWPVCSRERQLHIPFHQPNPHVRPGQLDVSLALRDQRMLNEWIHAPRKARQAMRNGLTRHFPAVPFQLGTRRDSEADLSDGNLCPDEEAPWELRKAPPGLKRSVCCELYRASKQTTDSLSAALNMITNHTLNAEKKADTEFPLPMEEDKENCNGLANGWSVGHHQKGLKNGTDAMDVEPDSFEPTSELEMNESEHMELAPDLPEIESTRNYDVLFVDNTIVSEISSASMTDHARKQPSPLPPPPPPTSPPMFVNLGLDLTLESITRYQTKPKSMYTFLCAQEFRRDEYSWHYQNVHSDIHGGLNGWLEQRCPLAHYGCMFSVRRFFPASPGSTLVHNDILESFGVKPKVPHVLQESPQERKPYQPSGLDDAAVQSHSPSPSIPSFSEFPFEVLQHVARFLDSFSLCNLAMTSRKLREVCCSLLDERGIVVQQWERHWNADRSTWKVAYKRWYFSTAFTPVHWWGFEDKESMANHLQKCVYFQRNVKTEPYYYPMQTKPNQHLYEKLYAAAKCSTSESQATKL